jgi:hypothetical protein
LDERRSCRGCGTEKHGGSDSGTGREAGGGVEHDAFRERHSNAVADADRDHCAEAESKPESHPKKHREAVTIAESKGYAKEER